MKERPDIEEYVVYCLYSMTYDKIYIGFTSNLIGRFASHNELGKKGFTRRYRPWVVIYVEFCDNKREALKREKRLKQPNGRAEMRKIVGLLSD